MSSSHRECVAHRLSAKILTDLLRASKGRRTSARIHELRDDPNQEERLRRILSEMLLSEWPAIADDALYVVEVGIACVGTWQVPRKPKRGRLKQETWGEGSGMVAGASGCVRPMGCWRRRHHDGGRQHHCPLRRRNPRQLRRLQGRSPHAAGQSFTLRLKLPGKGLKDLVLNFPYIFEATEPDDIETPQQIRRDEKKIAGQLELIPPPHCARVVCVVDSGIQEEHLWLEKGIDKPSSHCFVPEKSKSDVADYVANGGHGTRVAGAVLHGEQVPKSGRVELDTWLQTCRVLDETCTFSESMFPPACCGTWSCITTRASTNANLQSLHQRQRARANRHMSSWAAEIDSLSHDYDILIIQSSGNLKTSRPAPLLWHRRTPRQRRCVSGLPPDPMCRVSNPAQSLQARQWAPWRTDYLRAPPGGASPPNREYPWRSVEADRESGTQSNPKSWSSEGTAWFPQGALQP